jgi:Gas vesicle synthesis protein GvpO
MQLMQIAERAKAQLATATNLEPLLVSGMDKDAGGWRLTVEMIELDRIPEAQGIVGAYDVRVSDEGDLVTWHRMGLRRRDETDWVIEVIAPGPALVSAEESRGA